MQVQIPTRSFIIGLIVWLAVVIFAVLAFAGCKKCHNNTTNNYENPIAFLSNCFYIEELKQRVGVVPAPDDIMEMVMVDVTISEPPVFLSVDGVQYLIESSGRYYFTPNPGVDTIQFELLKDGQVVSFCAVVVPEDNEKDCRHRGHKHGHHHHQDCKEKE